MSDIFKIYSFDPKGPRALCFTSSFFTREHPMKNQWQNNYEMGRIVKNASTSTERCYWFFHSYLPALLYQVTIYNLGWREATETKRFAQGHKHDSKHGEKIIIL